jgi:hypothetical protein
MESTLSPARSDKGGYVGVTSTKLDTSLITLASRERDTEIIRRISRWINLYPDFKPGCVLAILCDLRVLMILMCLKWPVWV